MQRIKLEHSEEHCASKIRDEVAEWLRRWTANPLGFPRVGSNPILVELILQDLHFLCCLTLH